MKNQFGVIDGRGCNSENVIVETVFPGWISLDGDLTWFMTSPRKKVQSKQVQNSGSW